MGSSRTGGCCDFIEKVKFELLKCEPTDASFKFRPCSGIFLGPAEKIFGHRLRRPALLTRGETEMWTDSMIFQGSPRQLVAEKEGQSESLNFLKLEAP